MGCDQGTELPMPSQTLTGKIEQSNGPHNVLSLIIYVFRLLMYGLMPLFCLLTSTSKTSSFDGSLWQIEKSSNFNSEPNILHTNAVLGFFVCLNDNILFCIRMVPLYWLAKEK